MELVITFGIIFLLVIYVFIRGSIEEKRRRAKYREILKKGYGKKTSKEYKESELESIPRLFEHEREQASFIIDDITWNDLDMDRIYQMINFTQSSSGSELLYYLLRTPVQKCEELEAYEENIIFLQQEEETRLNLQMILHDLGATGKFSLYDYLDYLETLGKKHNGKHIAALSLLGISIVMIFFQTTLGVAALIAVMCYQIATYLKEKNKVLPYLSSFAYISRLIGCTEEILAQPMNGMETYKRDLAASRENLSGFKKGYRILSQMNASTGNPVELLIEYFKMVSHLDIMQFNRTLNQVLDKRNEILRLSKQIGLLDVWIAIGAFRASLPYYCVPTFERHGAFIIREGFHPSLEHPVGNTISQERGMLLTGSNASGKSTFLKMVALNAILGQTIHTCPAKEYKGDCYQIYSSMSLRDSLEMGESYYIVEIKALKRIMDIADCIQQNQEQNPLLCFVDEVLRGTNTVERIAASSKILQKLAAPEIYCFAATHDIELTHILEQYYDNYHFKEEVLDGDVIFSYQLLHGRAHTRNAIKLLKIIGFDDEIIKDADDLAARFLETGEWESKIGV